MSFELETATNRESLRRVAIDPVSRVEGHGKVTLLLDEAGHVKEARLHIVEFRGFEKFIQGRPYWEVPVMVQRLCGICPVSHHLAAAKALDPVVGAVPITATAEKIRRLMHYGQILQSHALHFFHLSSPDLLFGFESPVQQRNIVGVAGAYPEVARQGVLLRKFGQEVIRITAGKRVHGTGAVPGGVNKSLTPAERDELLQDADQMIQWSRDAVHLARRLHETNGSLYDEFGLFRSHIFSLVRADGAMDLYDGHLRLRDARGQIVRDDLACDDYENFIREEVKSWSYMKFPYITGLVQGRPAGAGAELRLHPQHTCRNRTPGLHRPRRRRAHSRTAGLPLGAHDRNAPRRRSHPQPARRPGHPLGQAHGRGPARA